jgi:hypothetical protein
MRFVGLSSVRNARTRLAWRLRQRQERGIYAASAWENPKDAMKFFGGGTTQTVKRAEG